MAYQEIDRVEMLEFIPDTVKRTIEFGCNTGSFSNLVKQKYDTEAWGVDMNSDYISKAETLLDKAILKDAFASLADLPKGYFDCIICNDFLEHLYEPDEFINSVKPYLSENATLVCSLPNVRYWKNLKEVIFEKDWRYRDGGGILDKTHYRFFTKKSMIRMLESCDLSIEKVKGINPTKSIRFVLPNILSFGIHNDMRFTQFGIRAKFNH